MCERTGAFVDGTVRGKYAVAGSFHDMTDHSQKAPRVDEKGGVVHISHGMISSLDIDNAPCAFARLYRPTLATMSRSNVIVLYVYSN